MAVNHFWWWGSWSRALGSVDYSFITITPWSTLTRSGKACKYPIYGPKKSVCELIVLDRNIIQRLHFDSTDYLLDVDFDLRIKESYG